MCWLFLVLKAWQECPVDTRIREGFLSADFMRRYRKHAVVIILVVAAIITPTSDVFTLSLVALPMWMLYEVSILIVKRSKYHKV